MAKIYLMIQESMVDGEVFVNVVPCADLKSAKVVMEEEVSTIISESSKYMGLDLDNPSQGYEIERTEQSIYINLLYDDYYECLKIEERDIVQITNH